MYSKLLQHWGDDWKAVDIYHIFDPAEPCFYQWYSGVPQGNVLPVQRILNHYDFRLHHQLSARMFTRTRTVGKDASCFRCPRCFLSRSTLQTPVLWPFANILSLQSPHNSHYDISILICSDRWINSFLSQTCQCRLVIVVIGDIIYQNRKSV